MMKRLLLVGLVPAVLLLGAACGGDDDSDGGDEPTATAAASGDASATATEEPMDDASATATEEPMEEQGVLAAVNGVSCTGGWTNLTFGSTGSFDAAFAANDAGDSGTVTITLGGNVFGVAGGTVELPLALDGDNVVVDAAADFLGNAKLTFDSSGAAKDAVFEAPPAFNNAASKATLEDFAFDGTSLTSTVQIDFGDGSTATSAIESTCS
ncbi:MAG: hypothetical protein O3A10_05635 [Chloroflexi bacterium]|nr:hypothetical protein [Chloroflexota bacterium]MDA1146160.1 hypothetical protein [Chloroflexota bacterium]